MNAKAITAVFALALTGIAGGSFSQEIQLQEFTASYEASANGLAATATRSLSRTGDQAYRLSNVLEARIGSLSVASLSQASEFTLQSDGLLPQNYSYQLGGASRASHAIFFNWEAGIALSSEDDESWQLELHGGVMDELSYQVAMRQTLLNNSAQESRFSFDIIDGDKIESHEYLLIGEEVITTPLGELNTLKLSRVREADDERVTEIWLAVDWNLLLARIEQINSSGLRIVLELNAAELEGNTVTARD